MRFYNMDTPRFIIHTKLGLARDALQAYRDDCGVYRMNFSECPVYHRLLQKWRELYIISNCQEMRASNQSRRAKRSSPKI